jgi:drug/metabolite transporter (DMT)-like permease
MAKRAPIRGEVWALGSVLGYASGNVCDSVAVTAADPLLGPFLRGLPSLVLGLGMMWTRHTWAELQPRSPRFVGRRAIMPFIWAGVLSTIGLFLYYFAIRMGGIILTVPLIETWVIWGTLAAWLMLGEELRGFLLLGWGAIGLGLAALIFGQLRGQPLTTMWYWAVPLGALAAVTYGLSGVLWRDGQLRGADQSTAILLQFISSVGVGLAGLLAMGKGGLLFSAPAGSLVSFLGGGVFSGVIAIYCIFKALRMVPVARVYAVSSLTPLTATLFARVFLHQYLNLPMLAGVVLICAGVILTQIFRARADAAAEVPREAGQETSAQR